VKGDIMELGEIKVGPISRTRFTNIRISQMGRCIRSLFYSVKGYPQEEPPKKTREMWSERSEDELRIIRMLRKKYKIKNAGEDQVSFYRVVEGTKIAISVTPDGLILVDKNWIPLEIKSLNPFKFESIKNQDGLSREYFIQVQGQMLLTKTERALYVIGNSKTKIDLKEFKVDFDERIIPWAERRINHIIENFKNETIQPEFFPGSKKCHWCLYKERCRTDGCDDNNKSFYNGTLHLLQEIKKDDFEYKNIEELARNFIALNTEYEDMIENLKETSHRIVEVLRMRKAGAVKVGKYKISGQSVLKYLGGLK